MFSDNAQRRLFSLTRDIMHLAGYRFIEPQYLSSIRFTRTALYRGQVFTSPSLLGVLVLILVTHLILITLISERQARHSDSLQAIWLGTDLVIL